MISIDRFALFEDDTAEVKCPACKKHSTVKVIDGGIGATEYWGSRSIHQSYVIVTTCCMEEIKRDDLK